MWILRLYLAREIFKATFVVLVILLAVLVLFLLIEEITDLGGNYTVSTALSFVALQIPGWAVKMFPLALMIGGVFALGRLADQSELTVIRSSGISANRILFSVLGAGLMLIIASLLISEFVVPKSELNALNLYNAAHKKGGFQKTRYGIWLRHKGNYFHIRKMQSGSNMKQVRYLEFAGDKLNKIISAPQAKLDNDGAWVLYKPTTLKFNNYQVEQSHKKVIKIKTEMSPEIIQQTQVEPKIQATSDLFEQRSYLIDNSLDSSEVDYALWSRLSYPFVTCLMLFLAFPFVLGFSRLKTVSQRIFIGIMVSIGFFVVSRVTEQLGILYQTPGWLTYFLPIVLFFGFGLVLFRRAT